MDTHEMNQTAIEMRKYIVANNITSYSSFWKLCEEREDTQWKEVLQAKKPIFQSFIKSLRYKRYEKEKEEREMLGDEKMMEIVIEMHKYIIENKIKGYYEFKEICQQNADKHWDIVFREKWYFIRAFLQLNRKHLRSIEREEKYKQTEIIGESN